MQEAQQAAFLTFTERCSARAGEQVWNAPVLQAKEQGRPRETLDGRCLYLLDIKSSKSGGLRRAWLNAAINARAGNSRKNWGRRHFINGDDYVDAATG